METSILVGLGNPGATYEGTRHNIGFIAVDDIATRAGAALFKEKWDAQTVRVSFAGEDMHIVKPQTFMNLSGKAVARFVDFYKIPLERIIVIHDDLDMVPGRLKLVKGGGAGGHNGIRSLVASLGESGFYRLKIGIGRPGSCGTSSKMPVERYVLASFGADERRILDDRLPEVARGIETFLQKGPAAAMNFLNSFK